MFGEAAAVLHQRSPSSTLTPVDSHQPPGILKVAPSLFGPRWEFCLFFAPQKKQRVVGGAARGGGGVRGGVSREKLYFKFFFLDDILPLFSQMPTRIKESEWSDGAARDPAG